MKKSYLGVGVLALSLAFLLVPVGVWSQVNKVFNPKEVGSPLELSIKENGTIVVHGLRVEQFAGKSFYTKIMWGDSPMRMTVRTTDKTVFTKKNDQAITLAAISVGDYLSVTGDFIPGSSSLDIQARTVKDWSVQTESAKYSGTIASVETPNLLYKLTLTTGEQVLLELNATSTLMRGSLRVGTGELIIGTKIVSAEGIFNQRTKTLTASFVRVYQDMTLFDLKTFEGTISAISPKSSPATITMNVEGKTYNVQINSATKVLNTARNPVSLERFIVGDTMRFSGYIQESDHSMVKATVVRNINL